MLSTAVRFAEDRSS